MAVAAPAQQQSSRLIVASLETLALIGFTVLGAAAVVMLGPNAIIYGVLSLAVAVALLHPRGFALALAAGIIVIEPNAILNPDDVLRPVARAFYFGPPEYIQLMPLTLPPVELLLLVTAGSLAVRARPHVAGAGRLPLLVWAAPLVLLLAIAYGLARGGPYNIVYHEARGLLFGMLAFLVAYRLRDVSPRHLYRMFLVAVAAFASVILIRHVLYFTGDADQVAFEHRVAHEGVIFLGYGFTLGAIALLREKRWSMRLLLVAQVLLVLLAAMVTGRRAATLVLGVGAIILLWLLLPKRTLAVLLFASAATVVLGAYLATHWHQADGTLAQPARAIRSQFDPTPRDLASNQYRQTEDYNKLQTIRTYFPLGIGFGHEFYQFEPLPDQTSFWPMQFYTGENNLLWLWLKTGYAGVSVLLGIWLLALARCLAAVRSVPRDRALPALPLVLAASLVLHLAFAQIDQGLSTTRAAVPLAVVLAIALGVPLTAPEPRGEPGERAVERAET